MLCCSWLCLGYSFAIPCEKGKKPHKATLTLHVRINYCLKYNLFQSSYIFPDELFPSPQQTYVQLPP